MVAINVSIRESLNQFVEAQISAGAHKSVSDYLEHLISEDQARKEQEEMEKQILEGLDSGPSEPLTREWIDEVRLELRQRALARGLKQK